MTKLGYIVVQTQLAFQTAWTQTVKVRTAALPPTVFVTPATDTLPPGQVGPSCNMLHGQMQIFCCT